MIRRAKNEDLDRVTEIYQIARNYMKGNGNPTQWGDWYPSREIVEDDIKRKQLYVYLEDEVIHGVFVFFIGEEPTYEYIRDGAWKTNAPYGVIHRVASDGEKRGVFGQCLRFSMERMDHIRIDTHHNNHTMQHVIEKNGFEKCGTIYVEDGSPRIAYQYLAAEHT